MAKRVFDTRDKPPLERYKEIQQQLSALPEAFDAKRLELAAAGVHAGPLVESLPYGSDSSRLSMQDYERVTLVCNLGRIFALYGPIRERWKALGGLNWGRPLSDVMTIAPGDGQESSFELFRNSLGGRSTAGIVWSEVTGARALTGLLWDRFKELGGAANVGYPIEEAVNDTAEPGAPDFQGLRPPEELESEARLPTFLFYSRNAVICRFRRAYVDDAESIIVIPRNRPEAWHVYGGHYRLWTALGRGGSPLGYPIGPEFGDYGGPDPQRSQYFEGGKLIWRPGSGSVVEMPEWHLRFRGLQVVWSTGDGELDANVEYFFLANTVPRVGKGGLATRLPVNDAEYGNLRHGRWRSDNIVLYHGTGDGVVLSLSGAERDTGDPEKYLSAFEQVSKKAVQGALAAVSGFLIGGAATKVVEFVEPFTQIVSKEIASAINGIFDTGDDALPPAVIALDTALILGFLRTNAMEINAVNADGSKGEVIPYHFTATLWGPDHGINLYFQLGLGSP